MAFLRRESVNVAKYFTLNDVNNIIETFEDFLKDYGVKIPESEKEKEEDNDTDNEALIYGMVYGDLQARLLEHFECLNKEGKVVSVVNSWDDEVSSWEGEK